MSYLMRKNFFRVYENSKNTGQSHAPFAGYIFGTCTCNMNSKFININFQLVVVRVGGYFCLTETSK